MNFLDVLIGKVGIQVTYMFIVLCVSTFVNFLDVLIGKVEIQLTYIPLEGLAAYYELTLLSSIAYLPLRGWAAYFASMFRRKSHL